MNQWYNNKTVWVVIVLLVIGGLFLFNSGNKENKESDTAIDEQGEVREGEILVMGSIACLPYRSGSTNDGCVKALKGDDGKMYALNSTAVRGLELSLPEGTKVSATGKFEVANTSVDDSSVFVYDGVLVLSSLKRQ